MSDQLISIIIATFCAVLLLFIIIALIKFFRVGLRVLLVKLKIISENDERSYIELIFFGIGKIIGRIFYGKK